LRQGLSVSLYLLKAQRMSANNPEANAAEPPFRSEDVQRPLTTEPTDCSVPNKKISTYLSHTVPAYRRLSEIREQGWKSKGGDDHFKNLRSKADNASAEVSNTFFNQMVENGNELQNAISGFKITRRVSHNSPPDSILEFGTAPGGFLQVALEVNSYASATAFTLPVESGGHPVRIDPRKLAAKVDLRDADITLFAADIGATAIPTDNPDFASFFLDRQIPETTEFDLVICGAGVLRTHERAAYREHRETRRLASTQLALGLEHIREGGTFIMLFHRIENWEVVKLLHVFDKFSDVQVFKPRRTHAIRSSFYLVAKNVRSSDGLARDLVQQYKEEWKVATFGSDEEFQRMVHKDDERVDDVLEAYGDKLGKLGRRVWETQATALGRQKWMK
jgi:23S rRNA U2552 (ribose-2'-O)-methylase RlmE/FtsJ